MDIGRERWEACSYQSASAWGAGCHHKPGRGKGGLSPRACTEHSHPNALVSDGQPPELQENKCLLCEATQCVVLWCSCTLKPIQ